MATLSDLAPCTYLPVADDNVIAIGWLGRDSAYERGPVDVSFLRQLEALCRDPWQPVVTAGRHVCDLCQFDGPAFSDNLFVPHDGKIYVAPVAVVHYVSAHWYLPPPVFVEAVKACPPTRSMDYKRALLANGGRSLLSLQGR